MPGPSRSRIGAAARRPRLVGGGGTAAVARRYVEAQGPTARYRAVPRCPAYRPETARAELVDDGSEADHRPVSRDRWDRAASGPALVARGGKHDGGAEPAQSDRGLDQQSGLAWCVPVDEARVARRHTAGGRDEPGLEGVERRQDLDTRRRGLTVADQRLHREDPVGLGEELVEDGRLGGVALCGPGPVGIHVADLG